MVTGERTTVARATSRANAVVLLGFIIDMLPPVLLSPRVVRDRFWPTVAAGTEVFVAVFILFMVALEQEQELLLIHRPLRLLFAMVIYI